MEEIEGPGIDDAPRGFERLAEAFARVQREQTCIDRTLLQEIRSLTNELVRSDSEADKLLALIRTAFSAYHPSLQYFAACAIVPAVARRQLGAADLRLLIKSQFDHYNLPAETRYRFNDRVPAGDALATISNLVRSNPSSLPDVLLELCARNCYEVESKACLIAYRETKDLRLERFLLTKADEFLTTENLFSDQSSAAREMLKELVHQPGDVDGIRKTLNRLLTTTKPRSSEREAVEETVVALADPELIARLFVAFEQDELEHQKIWGASVLSGLMDMRDVERHRQRKLREKLPQESADRIFELANQLLILARLPDHSDRSRRKILPECVRGLLSVFDRDRPALPVLIAWHGDTHAAKTDLTFLLSHLPLHEGLPFLQDCISEMEGPVVPIVTLAASYLEYPEARSSTGEYLVEINTDAESGARTWMGDETIERLIRNSLDSVDREFSRIFQANPRSHEERLTGFFLSGLQQSMRAIESDLLGWATLRYGGSGWLSCHIEDVASTGPEKVWAADVGFYLTVRIRNALRTERALLAQIKKAEFSGARESTWRIDPVQRDVLIGKSPFSVYILYGFHSTGLKTRVIPAAMVRGLMVGGNKRSRLNPAEVRHASKTVFVYRARSVHSCCWALCRRG